MTPGREKEKQVVKFIIDTILYLVYISITHSLQR